MKTPNFRDLDEPSYSAEKDMDSSKKIRDG